MERLHCTLAAVYALGDLPSKLSRLSLDGEGSCRRVHTAGETSTELLPPYQA